MTLFKKIDSSANGVIGFSELREWMTGRLKRQAKVCIAQCMHVLFACSLRCVSPLSLSACMQAREVHLLWGRDESWSLAEMVWVPSTLKRELVSMLQRAELCPTDLVRLSP